MKFAHLADCHIGGWRDEKMQALSVDAFQKAIDISISEGVDFILIAGDLFNTSIPAIDKIKSVVVALKRLREKDIPVYIIAGSHDFSPSGKTMLDVLEEADLFKNVCKGSVVEGKLKLDFTIDEKTGAKITGMLGKKGMLDRTYYSELLREDLEKEEGFKIFMFHTAITELKTKELQRMDSEPVSILPKNFNYYAGGHVHIIKHEDFDSHTNVVYPGPVSPNNFPELVKLRNGSMYLYSDGQIKQVPIITKKVETIEINCNHMTPMKVEHKLQSTVADGMFRDKIVTIRLFGTLESGRPSDINMKEVFDELYEKKAYFVLKNTHKLQSKEFQNTSVVQDTVQEIEEALIDEDWGKLSVLGADKKDEVGLIKNLMHVWSSEKHEGEKVADYESRIIEQSEKLTESLIGNQRSHISSNTDNSS